jgi:hypothetical protein
VKYSRVIQQRSNSLVVLPISTKIDSGSNGLTFEEMRSRLINRQIYGTTLISFDQINAYMSDLGFGVSKFSDDINDRIYIAKRMVLNNNRLPAGAAYLPTPITEDLLETTTVEENGSLVSIPKYSAVKLSDDGSITILPTALYKYDSNLDQSIMLSDAEISAINSLSPQDKAETFNESVYTVSPYVIRLNRAGRYPHVDSYDLSNPVIENLEFIKENVYIDKQFSVAKAAIYTHYEDGVFVGYRIRLGVTKTSAMTAAPSTWKILALATSITGESIYAEAIYATSSDDVYYYDLILTSEFAIDNAGNINISGFSNLLSDTSHYLNMTFDITLVSLWTTDSVSDADIISNDLNITLPTAYNLDVGDGVYCIRLVKQKLKVCLGTNMAHINNNVNLEFTALEYAKHENTLWATYPANVYEMNNGVPTYQIVDGDIQLNVLHKQNNYVFNTTPDTLSDLNSDIAVLSGLVKIPITDNLLEVGDPVKFMYYLNGNTANCGEYIAQSGTDSVGVVINPNASMVDVIPAAAAILVAPQTPADGIQVYSATAIHKKGDVILDVNNNVLLSKSRQIKYLVSMIHLDAKPIQSQSSTDAEYLNSIMGDISAHMSTLEEASLELIENTKLYYQPTKSIGTSSFKISENNTVNISNELTMKFRFFVKDFVLEDAALMTSIRQSTIDIIDNVTSSGTISLTALVNKILTTMPDYVSYVDVLGVNDNLNIQTLIPVNNQTTPILKHILIVKDDGTLALDRDIEIEMVSVT